jgi:hypothetical protein
MAFICLVEPSEPIEPNGLFRVVPIRLTLTGILVLVDYL